MRKWCLLVILCLLSGNSMAKQAYQTSDIPLLDNRFRVDFGVEQITFIIARKRFKEAVILVRPDGSKARISAANDRTRWLEGLDHDIITIDNPMPGPWQAIGDIAEENRIQLISDVKLEVEQLPIQLYSGERLRVTGALYNGKEQLHDAYVNNAELTMIAHGYHRSSDANFKFDFKELAKFTDRGDRFDELPADGIFTTYLKLDLDTGKYRFAVSVKNNVFTREVSQDVVVFPSPIKSKILPILDDINPQLVLDFDIEELDAKSIVIEGLVTNESKDEMDRFILHGKAGKSTFEYAIPRPTMFGGYRVALTMFATTSLGREIIVQLPPQAFVIPKPIEVNPALAVSEADLKAASEAAAAKLREEEERFNWMLWIIGGILFLVIAAIATLFGIKYWQRKKFEKAIAEQTPLPPEDTEEAVLPEAAIEEDLDLNSLNEPESK